MRSISSSETEEGEERAAGFVLFRTPQHDTRQYLLLRHCNDGHWAFPKGRLEMGEEELDAAVRETAEETNIRSLNPVSGFRETSQYRLKRDGQTIHKTVAYYLAETSDADVTLSPEHTEFRWVSFREAVHLLTYGESQQILSKADRLLGEYPHRRDESESR